MDINLPGLNGVECVRQLKGKWPATQFVMITVYEDPDHVFSALAAGATGGDGSFHSHPGKGTTVEIIVSLKQSSRV